MAVSNPNQIFNDAVTALERARATQTPGQTKSNTVVAAVGAVIAALLAGLTQWAAVGGALPEWAPIAILVLTLAAQVFGVSQTKNYITGNVIEQAKGELAAQVDQFHEHTAEAAATPTAAVDSAVIAEELAAQVERDISRALGK